MTRGSYDTRAPARIAHEAIGGAQFGLDRAIPVN